MNTLASDYDCISLRLEQTSGERRLCAAIINRALLDALFYPFGHPHRRDAWRFIFDEGDSKGTFRWAVEGAAVATVEGLREFLLTDSIPLEEKIRRVLRADPQVIKNRGKRKGVASNE